MADESAAGSSFGDNVSLKDEPDVALIRTYRVAGAAGVLAHSVNHLPTPGCTAPLCKIREMFPPAYHRRFLDWSV